MSSQSAASGNGRLRGDTTYARSCSKQCTSASRLPPIEPVRSLYPGKSPTEQLLCSLLCTFTPPRPPHTCEDYLAGMDSRESPTPPAAGTARPKNSRDVLARTSSSSISQPPPGAHATANPSSAAMASSSISTSTSRPVRGNTPTASRSATKLVDAETRPSSRDSLKQKMLKQDAKREETPPRPSKSEEVR
jgi:hypothetical protein